MSLWCNLIDMGSEDRRNTQFAFWTIFLFAAVVRLKGLSTGLPLHTLYGENDTLRVLQQILRTGDLNPRDFTLPGLAYYIYLPALYLFYLIGWMFGVYGSPAMIPDASILFVGRFVSACFGIASVCLVYFMGRKFSKLTAWLASAILACVPQHVEFSHMLRPETAAIFFVLLAHRELLNMMESPNARRFGFYGAWWGVAFSLKYNIGFPLFLPLLIVLWTRKKDIRMIWILQTGIAFSMVVAVLNPFLIAEPSLIPYWVKKVDAFSLPGEAYYGKNSLLYYAEFLARYNYNIPLLTFALLGLLLSLARDSKRAAALSVYPIALFLWLCSYKIRRVHGVLPLHPFLAIWAGVFLQELWKLTIDFSRSFLFKIAYVIVVCLALFSPMERSLVQTYLFSKVDNRSKAELWMANFIPRGSRVALLQFHQIELDGQYFNPQTFPPKDYIGKKDFQWFRDHGFDYVVASSGQYARYFTEGREAEGYRNYFIKLFRDGSEQGTLVLDLTTHPFLIPDYRIKIWSTRKLNLSPQFVPAIDFVPSASAYHLINPKTTLQLQPGYYSLEYPRTDSSATSVTVKNLKLNETILQTQDSQNDLPASSVWRFPFAIFPVRVISFFSLFSADLPEMTPDQPVHFSWKGAQHGLELKRIAPPIEVNEVHPSAHSYDSKLSYIRFRKHESFNISCTLTNRSTGNVSGHVQVFLSDVGEIQPWRNYDTVSQTEEFFLNSGQTITIAIPMNTEKLTGDFELSYWVFTREDLPFSPQNGGWLAKQIRVDDPKLGIHPIYGIAIP